MSDETFPSWRYGPGGAAQVFQSSDDVPSGWVDHPGKVKGAADPAGDAAEKRPSRVDLMKQLKERGIAFNPAATSDALVSLLADSEAAAKLDRDGDGRAGGSKPKGEPKPLARMNKTELLAAAEAEGVAIKDGATNKEIVKAIEAARDAV